jgi:hypothetical protein
MAYQSINFTEHLHFSTIMASWTSPLTLADGQWQGRLLLAITGLAMYCAAFIVYNIWFHPLSSFPGPWLARSTLVSQLAIIIAATSGRVDA